MIVSNAQSSHFTRSRRGHGRQATLLPYLFFLEADSRTQMRHVTSGGQHLSRTKINKPQMVVYKRIKIVLFKPDSLHLCLQQVPQTASNH